MKDVDRDETPAQGAFVSILAVTQRTSRCVQGGLLIRRLWVRVPPPERRRTVVHQRISVLQGRGEPAAVGSGLHILFANCLVTSVESRREILLICRVEVRVGIHRHGDAAVAKTRHHGALVGSGDVNTAPSASGTCVAMWAAKPSRANEGSTPSRRTEIRQSEGESGVADSEPVVVRLARRRGGDAGSASGGRSGALL